jgi:hypothetical protein
VTTKGRFLAGTVASVQCFPCSGVLSYSLSEEFLRKREQPPVDPRSTFTPRLLILLRCFAYVRLFVSCSFSFAAFTPVIDESAALLLRPEPVFERLHAERPPRGDEARRDTSVHFL